MSQQSVEQTARIIFAGSPEFAVPALNVLQASGHEVVAVLTQPDRPAGRGRQLQAGPVKTAALETDLPVLQPVTLKDESVQKNLAALNADLMVVVAYGLLLPPAVLAQPNRGCINLHASLLPRWRGASPIQTAILHGDKTTGISLMQMDEGLDTGPVFCTTTTEIGAHETAGELHDRLAHQGAELLAENLDALLSGSLSADPQATDGVSHAGIINKSDGLIDWQQPASAIDCQIRAYNPWPVAYTSYKGERLRCWLAEVGEAETDTAGPTEAPAGLMLTRSSAGIAVQTGRGVLQLAEVQLPGRKRVSAHEFANANDIQNVRLGL